MRRKAMLWVLVLAVASASLAPATSWAGPIRWYEPPMMGEPDGPPNLQDPAKELESIGPHGVLTPMGWVRLDFNVRRTVHVRGGSRVIQKGRKDDVRGRWKTF